MVITPGQIPPTDNSPYREDEVDEIEDKSRPQSLIGINANPRDINECPQIEARYLLLDVKHRPQQGQCRNRPEKRLEERFIHDRRVLPRNDLRNRDNEDRGNQSRATADRSQLSFR